MPFQINRLGVSLSGGGYRAAAFHLGTLKKLFDLGVLEQVDVLSTISGGSIVGAAWCIFEGDYKDFHATMIKKLQTKNIIRFILLSWMFVRTALFLLLFIGGALYISISRWHYLTFAVLLVFFLLLLKYQYKIFPSSQELERAYNRFFYNGKMLKDLKKRPILAIGASNLQTGRPFTFSKKKMSDSAYLFSNEYDSPIHFKHDNFPIARAVAASSCVPFAFSPIGISKEFFFNEDQYSLIKPVLIDGGVYDNQGIQKLTQAGSSYQCLNVITSDAGGSFMADKRYSNAIALLIRTVDLFMNRIKSVQMVQNIYQNDSQPARPIAYFSLGWQLENAIPGFLRNMENGKVLREVIAEHRFPDTWINDPKRFRNEITEHLKKRVNYPEIIARDLTEAEWNIARNTGTNLTCLTKEQIEYLGRHAENLTELQVKLYCPTLFRPKS